MFPAYDECLQALASGRRLIRFDRRGTGSSQRDVDDLSHEANIQDLGAVVDAAKLERFSIMASAASVPPALAYVATHQDRLEKLILLNTLLGGRDRGAAPVQIVDAFVLMARTNWPLAAQMMADRMNQRRLAPYLAMTEAVLYVRSADGESSRASSSCGRTSASMTRCEASKLPP
jgi:pimeloyl-ACP methyl ester carboxylesterase